MKITTVMLMQRLAFHRSCIGVCYKNRRALTQYHRGQRHCQGRWHAWIMIDMQRHRLKYGEVAFHRGN